MRKKKANAPARGEYTWYIDPIDGTRAFMTGSPLWGTLIGLTRGAQPLFGVLVQPVLEEVFFGAPNGSWLIKADQRVRLRRRACTALDQAVLACTHPDMFAGARLAAFNTLAGRCLLHRFGGDCYNYAMLAAGFVDLVVEGQLKPFDIVPLLPILEGAGCVVTDWRGDKPLTGRLRRRGGDAGAARSRAGAAPNGGIVTALTARWRDCWHRCSQESWQAI